MRQGTTAAAFNGRAEQAIRQAVTAVVFTIAGLTFAFGFGAGGEVQFSGGFTEVTACRSVLSKHPKYLLKK